MTNNAAERRVRTVAIGRRNWTFCGSDRGGDRAAAMYTLIQTCRLNDVDPHAWLRDVIRADLRPSADTNSRAVAVGVESSTATTRARRASRVASVAPK
jgi:hypothetical protein